MVLPEGLSVGVVGGTGYKRESTDCLDREQMESHDPQHVIIVLYDDHMIIRSEIFVHTSINRFLQTPESLTRSSLFFRVSTVYP